MAAYGNFMLQNILRTKTDNDILEITFNTHPLPLTVQDKEVVSAITGVTMTIFIAFAY
jgi:hypothetical protein